MTDQPQGSAGQVTIVDVLNVQLKEINRKLDFLLADHDSLIRLQVQVEQNKTDIGHLAKTGRERDKVRRRESFMEMLIAAAIGAGAWVKTM